MLQENNQKHQEKDKVSDFICLIKELFFSGKFYFTHELSRKSHRILQNVIAIMIMVAAYQWGIWVYFYTAFQKFTAVNIPHVAAAKMAVTNTTGAYLISQFSGSYSFSVHTAESWLWVIDICWRVIGLTQFAVGFFVLLSLVSFEWLPNRRKYFMIIAASLGALVSIWERAWDAVPNFNLFANTGSSALHVPVLYLNMALFMFALIFMLDFMAKRRHNAKADL